MVASAPARVIDRDPIDNAFARMFGGPGAPTDQEVCSLREATQLPLSIVYGHFRELRDAIEQPGFAVGTFLEEAQRSDTAKEVAAQRERDARMREDLIFAVIIGAAMFFLPLAGVYATWSSFPWMRRRLNRLSRRTWLDVASVTGVSLVAFGVAGTMDSDSDRFLVTLGVTIATSAVLAQRRRHSEERLTEASTASRDPLRGLGRAQFAICSARPLAEHHEGHPTALQTA